MQLRPIAIARWFLPLPVPPINTALRCSAINPPPARSRTSVSLIGVPSNWKSSRSLASGSLAMVSWYLIERALLLVDLGSEQVADDALRLMLAFDGRGHDLIEGGLHAVELKFAHQVEELGSFHQMVLLRLS